MENAETDKKQNEDSGTHPVQRQVINCFACTTETLEVFSSYFDRVSRHVNQIATLKGWWKGDRNEGELIALMHSELSEALEALRHGNPPDDKISSFSGVEAELADTIIRIMDMAAAKGYRVGPAIAAKIQFNETREHMHGGKHF